MVSRESNRKDIFTFGLWWGQKCNGRLRLKAYQGITTKHSLVEKVWTE